MEEPGGGEWRRQGGRSPGGRGRGQEVGRSRPHRRYRRRLRGTRGQTYKPRDWWMGGQTRINRIVPYLISILPRPLSPRPRPRAALTMATTTSPSPPSTTRPPTPPWTPTTFKQLQVMGRDHINRLPAALLSSIIFHLPTKEVTHTMALSRSWCGVWVTTPLLVNDTHLKATDGPR